MCHTIYNNPHLLIFIEGPPCISAGHWGDSREETDKLCSPRIYALVEETGKIKNKKIKDIHNCWGERKWGAGVCI